MLTSDKVKKKNPSGTNHGLEVNLDKNDSNVPNVHNVPSCLGLAGTMAITFFFVKPMDIRNLH